MYREILLGIGGIHVFPVISLVLFVAVFSVMLVRVAMMDGAGIRQLAALPLDDSTIQAEPSAAGRAR